MILSLANAYSFHTESTRARLENLCVNQDFNTILQVLKAIIKKFSRSLETLRATKTKQRQPLLFCCVCSRSLFCLLKEMWITDCYCCSTFFFFFGWGVDYLQIDIIAVYHTKASSPRSKLCGTAQELNRYYRSSLL